MQVQTGAESGQDAQLRVLLVEDDAKLAYAVRMLFELDGRAGVVDVVGDGLAAVDRALELRPDVAVIDIRLPRQNGLDAAAQIVAVWPEARIIVYSGDPSALARAADAGWATLSKDEVARTLADRVVDVCGPAH